MTLKKLDDDRYRAEINYMDKEGQKQHHEFEGTREQIRSHVKAKNTFLRTNETTFFAAWISGRKRS